MHAKFENLFEIVREANQFLSNKDGNNGRVMRRFLTRAAGGYNMVHQVFSMDEGYSKEQLKAIESHAKHIAELVESNMGLHDLKPNLLCTVNDFGFGLVQNSYVLPYPVATASVKELREMVKLVGVLADLLADFPYNKKVILQDCPLYFYRGLPCNAVAPDELWEIGGEDLNSGGSGVLEWCVSEVDAQEVLERMRAHEHQFRKLTIRRSAEAVPA